MEFLVDVNLPKYFHYFNNDSFIFVADLNPRWTDQEIWNYALENNLVILTKDTDFYNRYIVSEKSPKIVYFQIGNHTLQELHLYFKANWEYIIEALSNSNLIIATDQKIVLVN